MHSFRGATKNKCQLFGCYTNLHHISFGWQCRELEEMKLSFIRQLGNACLLSQQHEWCSGLPCTSASCFIEGNSTFLHRYQCSSQKEFCLYSYINVIFLFIFLTTKKYTGRISISYNIFLCFITIFEDNFIFYMKHSGIAKRNKVSH